METPDSGGHYRRPPSRFPLLIVALVSAAAVVVFFAALHLQGARRPWSPGRLASPHAAFEAACEKCHDLGASGASSLCLRCHDSGGNGYLGLAAHALSAGGKPVAAARSEELSCTRCHVEHEGREALLTPADRAECGSCHFKGFEFHPDFEVLRDPSSAGTPGIEFSHQRHLEEFVEKQGLEAHLTCSRCHESAGADFAPLAFDRHCASCHLVDGSLGMVPALSTEDVDPPEAISLGPDDFERSRGRIGKSVLRHKDEWVLHNLRKLQSELVQDPQAPPDGARLGAAAGAVLPQAGLARLGEVWTLLEADSTLGARAARLRQEAASLSGERTAPSPLLKDDFEKRREEIRRLLGAVEGIEDPNLQETARGLRARIEALAPGESSPEVLRRALEKRARLPAEQSRKEEAIEMLTASCATCHLPSGASPVPLFQVSAARPVLTGSRFNHRPHLLQLEGDCTRCHAGIEASASSRDVNFGGVGLCQSCHRAGESRKDCGFCHRYHAEEGP